MSDAGRLSTARAQRLGALSLSHCVHERHQGSSAQLHPRARVASVNSTSGLPRALDWQGGSMQAATQQGKQALPCGVRAACRSRQPMAGKAVLASPRQQPAQAPRRGRAASQRVQAIVAEPPVLEAEATFPRGAHWQVRCACSCLRLLHLFVMLATDTGKRTWAKYHPARGPHVALRPSPCCSSSRRPSAGAADACCCAS